VPASFAGGFPPLTENRGRALGVVRHTLSNATGDHMMIPLIVRVMLTALGFERSIADLLVEVVSFLMRIIG
jgi:hypothetical protein